MQVLERTIRAKECLRCGVCGSEGSIVYERLDDRLFGAPGSWNLKQCLGPDCGLLWLDPMPIPEDIAIAYRQYYTHGSQEHPAGTATKLFRAFKSLLAAISGLKWHERLVGGMYLMDKQPGRLLDVGCGSGDFMAKMRAVGWHVEGIDVDSDAVAEAGKRGLTVRCEDLMNAGYPDNHFDAIVMGHVVEHLFEPTRYMSECCRILKRQGSFVIVTPNASSWGHKKFRSDWRGLEPPRHLQIFSKKALHRAALGSGFSRVNTWTTCARAQYMLKASLDLKLDAQHEMNGSMVSPGRSLFSWFLQYVEFIQMLWRPNSGEELVSFAVK